MRKKKETGEENADEVKEERPRTRREVKRPAWMASNDFILALASSTNVSSDPTSFQEALDSECKQNWLEAMREEMEALAENETWELVSLPKDAKLISNRWVFKTKLKEDGSVDRFRARLVARGFTQEAGVDYGETFSPVARYDTVRIVLAVAAVEKLLLAQFDVKTAFLYGLLQEEVYMNQPEGFDDGSGRVCRLKRSLYGLKQAPRCWNNRFVNFMKRQGLEATSADPCLFVRKSGNRKLIVALYVDDGLVAGSDQDEINSFIKKLQAEFKITKGSMNNFIGMQIKQSLDGILVNQKVYIENMLKRFNMDQANSLSTPCGGCEKESEELVGNEVPYREAVGCLMFLMIATRPDIAFAVSRAARAVEKPTTADWLNVKRIFRYLRATSNYGLFYRKISNNKNVDVYSDADFGGDVKTRRSTTGVVATFAGGAVSWSSRLQKSVALSTTEAEFVAASEGAKELIWLTRLLNEIGVDCTQKPTLHVDNASAVKLTKNPEFHKRSKHIEIRYFFVRECYLNNQIAIEHISGNNQIADILTKFLSRERFETLREKLGVKNFGSAILQEEVLKIK